MTGSLIPRVVFQPATGQRIRLGIHKMVGAVRPTLGPRARLVALERNSRSETPELLADAGTIARRIIELPDRDEDIGAMLARKMIWRVHDRAGDGAATAAVIFESVFDQGLIYLAAGGNAMLLQRHLERGLQVVLDELAGMTRPLHGQARLTQFAHSICQDQELARLLGEVMDIIGEWGHLDVRASDSRESEREYVEGMYWDAKPFSREMLAGPHQIRVDLQDAAILVSDLAVQEPEHLVPVLNAARQTGARALLLTARELSTPALAMLLANNKPDQFQVVAVQISMFTTARMQALEEDLSLLTGGRVFAKDAGDRLERVQARDLGRARRAWADQTHFGIIGGRGDPRALRKHQSDLKAAFARAKESEVRQELRERIGKLTAGSATLWVGGVTETEITFRKELAGRTAEALRGAMREGVVPGGGAALLACRGALKERLAGSSDLDERAALRILLRALEEPTRTIIANAGCDVAEAMAAINRAGPGYGFEVHSEQAADMAQAGILDATSVTRMALTSAVMTAALALTTDVLVHHKKPVERTEP